MIPHWRNGFADGCYFQFLINQSINRLGNISVLFQLKMIKKPEKTRNLQNTDSERIFFSPNIWHVNIASLQFYKQMYNNASRICDGEESSSAFFFFSSLLLDGLLFFIFIFLWGVLVLLCTAAAKIYPAHVVSVCYSMVGAAPAVGCGISAHRSWGGKKVAEIEKW